MTISERIQYFKEWIDYIKSKDEDDLTEQNKQDLIVLEETVKDLEALETLVDNSSIVIENDNKFFMVRIKEYDYLRRPIDDFDKVKYLIERR